MDNFIYNELPISAKVNYEEFNIKKIYFPENIYFSWDFEEYKKIIRSTDIIDNYDTLLKESKEYNKKIEQKIILFIKNCVKKEQIMWDMNDGNIFIGEFSGENKENKRKKDNIYDVIKKIDEDILMNDSNNKECEDLIEELGGDIGIDCCAYYSPACFYPPQKYGIHIFKKCIVSEANEILEKLKNKNIIINKEDALTISFIILWWHELTHAWIEDLCTIITSLTGCDLYSKISKYYNSYIYMEEGICNSSSYGNLSTILDSKYNNKDKKNILDVVDEIFKNQPKGYRNYKRYDKKVDIIDNFYLNIYKLLYYNYRFDEFSVKYSISNFFDTARIIDYGVFSDNCKSILHEIEYGAYGHSHRNELSEKPYHRNVLPKIGGELYYKHYKYPLYFE